MVGSRAARNGFGFPETGRNPIRFFSAVTYNGNAAVPILQIMPDYGKTALDLGFTKSLKTNAVKYK
jgi:hypothetical protein